MNEKIKTIIQAGWDKWHSGGDPEFIPETPSPSFQRGALVMLEALRPLISGASIFVDAHAKASHMIEGFRPKRNKWDDLNDEIMAVLEMDDS